MTLATGRSVGPMLIQALGLPKNTVSFALRVAVDEVVSVTCTYNPEKDGVVAGIDVLSQTYALVPVDKALTTLGQSWSMNPDGTRRWPGPSNLSSKAKEYRRKESLS